MYKDGMNTVEVGLGSAYVSRKTMRLSMHAQIEAVATYQTAEVCQQCSQNGRSMRTRTCARLWLMVLIALITALKSVTNSGIAQVSKASRIRAFAKEPVLDLVVPRFRRARYAVKTIVMMRSVTTLPTSQMTVGIKIR